MRITDQEAFQDFRTIARHCLRLWDVDPMYPLLRRVYEKRNLDDETALWYTLIYTNWYWMSSSEAIYHEHPTPDDWDRDARYQLRVRKERRCIYPGEGAYATAFINGALDKREEHGSLQAWVDNVTAPGGKAGWRAMRDDFEDIPYAGGWASYKWCDLLAYTHGVDITADDMGSGAGSAERGPIRSIMELTDLDSFNEVTNATDAQDEFYELCLDHGVPFAGIEQMETTLCNYLSTTRKLYYVGSDLDDMMEQLDGVSPVFWEARNELFPPELLGERHGWSEKSNAVRAAYAEDGVIRWWKHGYDGRPTTAYPTWQEFPWDDRGYDLDWEP